MTHYDLVIIGTGSGNSILDERFSDKRVAIVEKGVFGGTCLNVGCIPTKMFVYPADLAHDAATSSNLGVDAHLDGVRWRDIRDRIFGRIDPIAVGGLQYRQSHEDNANVDVYTATARFTGPKTLNVDGRTITADQIVLAAGGRPAIPDVAGLDEIEYHTSDTVMRLDELPKSMIILGAGFIAAEFAHIFSAFGTKVSLIARSNRLLRKEDETVSERFTEIGGDRWDVHFESVATQANPVPGGGVEVTLDSGDTLRADVLLIATGRQPNTDLLDLEAAGVSTVDGAGPSPDHHPSSTRSARQYVWVDEYQRTSVDGVYALGDISSPHELKHVANHEARVVGHNLLHPDDPIKADHRFVPHAVFTSPQIASVGLTEQQARDRGARYVAAVQEYGDVAYGWAMEDTTGLLKLLADPASKQLIGAHIIGPQAPTVIQPLIQAMSFGIDAPSMARGQYWIHPAMPEVIENALLKLGLDG